ncbi:hypothetical protein L1887_38818 [Cichorium endivia]|nr:hypothetical protein L1887_38818 [Cichorium endivia]
MAEVVVTLDNILTLQEKNSRSLQAGGTTIFGRVLELFPFASNGDNSADADSKLSSNSKGDSRNAGGDTRRAENKDFKIRTPSLKIFKFADLETATRNFSQDLLLGTGSNGDVFLGWVDKNTFAPSTQGVGIAIAVKTYGKGLPELQKQDIVTIGCHSRLKTPGFNVFGQSLIFT